MNVTIDHEIEEDRDGPTHHYYGVSLYWASYLTFNLAEQLEIMQQLVKLVGNKTLDDLKKDVHNNLAGS